MKRILIVALAMAAIHGPAKADPIVQTSELYTIPSGNGPAETTFNFNKFNPADGELTGVTISINFLGGGSFSYRLFAEEGETRIIPFNMAQSVTANMPSGPLSATSSFTDQVLIADSLDVSPGFILANSQDVNSSNFAAYTGVGTFEVTVSGTATDNTILPSGVEPQGGGFGLTSGFVTVTYIVAVPEPPSYALLGVVGIVGALAYRRRKLAIAG